MAAQKEFFGSGASGGKSGVGNGNCFIERIKRHKRRKEDNEMERELATLAQTGDQNTTNAPSQRDGAFAMKRFGRSATSADEDVPVAAIGEARDGDAMRATTGVNEKAIAHVDAGVVNVGATG